MLVKSGDSTVWSPRASQLPRPLMLWSGDSARISPFFFRGEEVVCDFFSVNSQIILKHYTPKLESNCDHGGVLSPVLPDK